MIQDRCIQAERRNGRIFITKKKFNQDNLTHIALDQLLEKFSLPEKEGKSIIDVKYYVYQ